MLISIKIQFDLVSKKNQVMCIDKIIFIYSSSWNVKFTTRKYIIDFYENKISRHFLKWWIVYMRESDLSILRVNMPILKYILWMKS